MGFFNRKPKAGDLDAPRINSDGETTIVVLAGNTTWSYKKVLKALGWAVPDLGGGSERLTVTLRTFGSKSAGIINATHEGQPLGVVIQQDVPLVRSIMSRVGSDVIRAEAYIWRSQKDGTLGLRVYLSA